MDRQELFRTESAILMEPVFQRSVAALMENYAQNEQSIKGSLQDVLANLCSQAGALQERGEKDAIAWLGICYFLSSTYTGNYEIRMDLYDSESYLDERSCYLYWNPGFITSYLLEDRAYFQKNIRQKVPRVKTWEEQQFLGEYARSYMYILGEFLRQQVPDILKEVQRNGVLTTDDFRIFFGEYMGKYIVLDRNEDE